MNGLRGRRKKCGSRMESGRLDKKHGLEYNLFVNLFKILVNEGMQAMFARKTADITEIALLTALIAVTGAFKLPGLFPGAEFQLSAPLAVAICSVFGFRKYIVAGILASSIGMMLGTQNFFHMLIAMQFRLVVGAVLALGHDRPWALLAAGPIGTTIARLTLAVFLGQAAYAMVAAAVPGMIFTAAAAPLLARTLRRVQTARQPA